MQNKHEKWQQAERIADEKMTADEKMMAGSQNSRLKNDSRQGEWQPEKWRQARRWRQAVRTADWKMMAGRENGSLKNKGRQGDDGRRKNDGRQSEWQTEQQPENEGRCNDSAISHPRRSPATERTNRILGRTTRCNMQYWNASCRCI